MIAEPPASLTDRAFLVPYHLEKKKLTGLHREHLVQAAVLVELTRRGLLTDADGRPQAAAGSTGEAVLDDVLDRIRKSKPRPWTYWIGKDRKITYQAVRDRLARQRVVAVSPRRALRLFPRVDVHVRDTRVVRSLVGDLRRALLGGLPPERLPRLDADLVALVAAVELDTVFSGRERRAQRDRTKELTGRAGPAAAALRTVIETEQSAITAG